MNLPYEPYPAGSARAMSRPDPPVAIRWPLVGVIGALVTAASSVTLAASVLLVVFTYGIGIFLLPIPLGIIVGFVVVGGMALKRVGVARAHAKAWCTSLVTCPVIAVVSITVPWEVLGDLPGAKAHFWWVWGAGVVIVPAVLGAAAWLAVCGLTRPRPG